MRHFTYDKFSIAFDSKTNSEKKLLPEDGATEQSQCKKIKLGFRIKKLKLRTTKNQADCELRLRAFSIQSPVNI